MWNKGNYLCINPPFPVTPANLRCSLLESRIRQKLKVVSSIASAPDSKAHASERVIRARRVTGRKYSSIIVQKYAVSSPYLSKK